ncbi:hypothetical protein ASE95_06740 [Sphingomonas sp. Leaf231]|uniref:hypothetical protein n=1 Tax=Sphingomonas sp. Leaf231 TaxID=1736301 RepID=UPI000701507E|nr:hypothetical protein [Sphingomonas sp. Leaf231]KQN92427.1 hypothetical protein ASE95_06740 [Sphingomonas sp. Leaf231]
MTDRTPRPAGSAPVFTPARLRPRHDGWTPTRQVAFIEALAATACVEEAARHVGMSREAAYALRRHPGAYSFRQAWDLALDHGISRLADAALGRALHGTATPIFYKGEQIGERRRYDEKLTMFLLRYRDPCRYGAWRDRTPHHAGGDKAQRLGRALRGVMEDAAWLASGEVPPQRDADWLDNDDAFEADAVAGEYGFEQDDDDPDDDDADDGDRDDEDRDDEGRDDSDRDDHELDAADDGRGDDGSGDDDRQHGDQPFDPAACPPAEQPVRRDGHGGCGVKFVNFHAPGPAQAQVYTPVHAPDRARIPGRHCDTAAAAHAADGSTRRMPPIEPPASA